MAAWIRACCAWKPEERIASGRELLAMLCQGIGLSLPHPGRGSPRRFDGVPPAARHIATIPSPPPHRPGLPPRPSRPRASSPAPDPVPAPHDAPGGASSRDDDRLPRRPLPRGRRPAPDRSAMADPPHGTPHPGGRLPRRLRPRGGPDRRAGREGSPLAPPDHRRGPGLGREAPPSHEGPAAAGPGALRQGQASAPLAKPHPRGPRSPSRLGRQGGGPPRTLPRRGPGSP